MKQLFILGIIGITLILIGCAESSIEPVSVSQQNKVVDSQKTTVNKENANNEVAQKDQDKSQDYCSGRKTFIETSNCYISLAKTEKDTNICNKLEKELPIQDCLFEVLPNIGTAELCNRLSDENDRKICYFKVGVNGKDIEGCNNLPENSIEVTNRVVTTYPMNYIKLQIEKKKCFEGYYSNVMEDEFEKLDKSICDYFKNKDECLEKLAKLKGEPNYCPRIFCVMDIAKSKKDQSLCDEAGRLFEGNWDETIQECKDDIAIETLDPNACITPSCVNSIAIQLGDISICFKGGSKYCYERAITGAGFGVFDEQGNTFGFDTDLTLNDCNTMKQKCKDCSENLYNECVFRTLILKSDLKEEDCNILSDDALKRSCIYQS